MTSSVRLSLGHGKRCIFTINIARAPFFSTRARRIFRKNARASGKTRPRPCNSFTDGVWYCIPENYGRKRNMRSMQNRCRNHSRARSCLAAAGMLLCVLLLDFVLTLFAAGRGAPPSGGFLFDPAPAPQSFRTAAERTGNLAAMHEGAGSGVQVQMRGGRTSPTFARRLQSESARLSPAHVREFVPMHRECLESTAQTFLFQLFPRCFLPVRAGPVPA